VIPVSAMNFFQRSTSARIYAEISSGLPGAGTMPCFMSRFAHLRSREDGRDLPIPFLVDDQKSSSPP